MNQALFSSARTVSVPRPTPHAAEVTYTIRVLSTEKKDDGREVKTVLFSRTSNGETIEISAETDSPNLLAKLPDLLDAAMDLQRSLWPAQRTISRLPSSFFPKLAEESRLLRHLTDTAPDDEQRELSRRRVYREAMIVRDVAWEAIRKVLPPERRPDVDSLVAMHESAPELATSMDAMAALIDAMLGDPEDVAILAACDIDTLYAAALRRHATVLRAVESETALPTDPSPRPRVLKLIGMAYRALRTDSFLALSHAEAPPRVVAR
jgi:hypothetical protein